ncbi:MAG: hypothetical protein C4527_12065 [Candidatus Omnitrophota bacterium]|jgi:spore coat protein CotH|nr:MAG: hypothetical protein C4527_12065 [Candidatus Omnitrophota bacterium]
MNDRDESGNLYKIAYNEGIQWPNPWSNRIRYANQTNLDASDDDILEMLNTINFTTGEEQSTAVRQYLVTEKVMAYSIAGVLMCNWDGFFNNMFLYHDPMPGGQWECIPWDLDKTFGYIDPGRSNMYTTMPLTFPLDGRGGEVSREPGPVSRAFHSDAQLHEEYVRQVRQAVDGLFAEERLYDLVEEVETFLNEDLNLLEQYAGVSQSRRRQQIEKSYETMRTFIRLRHNYLRQNLPVEVGNWSIY